MGNPDYTKQYPEMHTFLMETLFYYLTRKIPPSSLEVCLPNDVRRFENNLKEGENKIPSEYKKEYWEYAQLFGNDYEPFSRIFNVPSEYIEGIEKKCIETYQHDIEFQKTH